MVVRLLLAVVLSVALLAVAVPALGDVRTDRTATALDAATDHVLTTSTDLLARSDATTDGPAARVVVRVDVPGGGWGARAGHFRVADGELAWRVGGGRWHVKHTPRLVVPDGPVVVSEPSGLVLTHRVRDGRSVVVVRRGFK